MLKAGVASADITPGPGIGLGGYPHCPRENEGVHDPLLATAVYLGDGEDHVVLVTLDLLTIGKEIVAAVRRATGREVLFTVSHSHSSPRTSETFGVEQAEGIRMNRAYAASVQGELVRIIGEAERNAFEAEIGFETGRCGADRGVGGNRRQREGICDDSVNVLAVREAGGPIRAVLVNYSLHPTYLHADNVLVSADYPGFMRRYFAFAEPDAAFLFAQGTSGDQSSRYHRVGQTFEEAARVGTTIACEADACLDRMEFRSDLKLAFHRLTVEDLPLKRFPPVEEALEAKREAERAFEEARGGNYLTLRNAELAMFGAQNLHAFACLSREGRVESPELPYEVQFVKIGELLIVGLQSETFVKYGLQIKNMSPARTTFVFGLSNGYAPGYLYTPEAGEEGGYEVGTSVFAPEAGEVLMQRIGEEMKKTIGRKF